MVLYSSFDDLIANLPDEEIGDTPTVIISIEHYRRLLKNSTARLDSYYDSTGFMAFNCLFPRLNKTLVIPNDQIPEGKIYWGTEKDFIRELVNEQARNILLEDYSESNISNR